MRRLRILYDGTPMAGRCTTLAHLVGVVGEPPPRDQGPYKRMGESILLSSGETILLDAFARHTGSLRFKTIEDAASSNVDWIRNHFRELIPFLSSIDGIVYVADSDPSQQTYEESIFRDTLEQWRKAGIDVDRIPVVFQCNKRDLVGARPIAEMAATLSTPRCVYAESVATAGYGLVQTLERLVELIDQDAPKLVRPRPQPAQMALDEASAAKPVPKAWLFECHDRPVALTYDGRLQATLLQSTLGSEVVVKQGAIFSIANNAVFDVPAMVPGHYVIDIVRRQVSLEEASGRRLLDRPIIASRFRLRGASASSHALLGLSGLHLGVVIGDAEMVHAASTDNLRIVSARGQSEGVVVASWRGGCFEPGSTGEIAFFRRGSPQMWIGRDDSGRVIEILWCPGGRSLCHEPPSEFRH